MKPFVRHFAAAAMAFCPLLMCGQEASLPAAPSAVAVQRGFELASETTFVASPGARASFSPTSHLNSEQKFNSFVEQSFSPAATFSSAISAGFRPAWNNSQFNESYAGRLGHAVEDQTEQGFFTKFLLPTLLHQDPRYHPSTAPTRMGRATYAISRIVIGRTDNGRSTFNTSELLGAVLAASVPTAYHDPHPPTTADTASRAAAGLGTDIGMNMLREFWPDIRDCVRDHGPKMMQSLVTRLGPRLQSTPVAPAN
jgi:hypothetical protein